ncbi:xanthine dehydrogenase subunit D [Actinospica sp. MGRD01-02]|uniref:Xanthine dehydrogenase subunit D n=1 Tax=Actinospica acidithermotolerans TaxID=2828514 RepID=A0A941EL38_9ACTN|nr:xanthine dehydrogenase subunit D [Actinospica acidithermotolerans]MBR7829564.1 xanthine dehydrogenase subunit D [Actinospica acidithermotolerans]
MTVTTSTPVHKGIGGSPLRPDGTLKVTGEFAYSSDLWAEGMLYGSTLRSPHPRARIVRIDTSAAAAMAGVHAVLTSADIPGKKTYGLIADDCPVLAIDEVRYHGEPVAVVAADDLDTARRAAKAIVVEYEVLEPVSDMRRAAFDAESPRVHADRADNIVRYQPVRRGNPDAADLQDRVAVVVTREYEVGMQDQAFLGPESGLAIPTEDGGVDLHVATQWLHVDQEQMAPCLALPPEKVQLTLAGVGGAFGGREDLSMQIHASMLALRTKRPVKMVYDRRESFFGHVHRHPALMKYTHAADADGRLVYAKAQLLLDGGAYASTTDAVVGNAASLGIGPYECDDVLIEAYGLYTNNPPCGAMRGFGAVQACFAYESQMDEVAAALGMDPVEIRRINAVKEGSILPTGQRIEGPAPLREILDELVTMPMPPEPSLPEPGEPEPRTRVPGERWELPPGGYGNTTRGEGVRRGVGYGVGIKNICYSEGFDDFSTARVRLEISGGEPIASVHTAAAEVGQGLVTLQAQIARTELGVDHAVVLPADTQVGSAGSSSASRQSYMTGGAVKTACEAVRMEVIELARRKFPELLSDDESWSDIHLADGALHLGAGVATGARLLARLSDVLGTDVVEATREYHHRRTNPLDPETGQGDSHVQFAMAAHRAVVDVDVELGLVHVVQMDVVQDVGKILNRLSLEGQIQGGTAQGLGLALMEEIQTRDGLVRNPSFTDYLIPTILDMPPLNMRILEFADPNSPYGLRGAGEPPTLSSTPAIVAAVRAACGRPLRRIPLRPEQIALVEGYGDEGGEEDV